MSDFSVKPWKTIELMKVNFSIVLDSGQNYIKEDIFS